MMARGVVWEDLRNWEVGSLGVFSRLVARSRLFLDVGAYTGIYSLIACVDGPGAAVAFEPNPAVRPLLATNLAANRLEARVELRSEGLSDAPGSARLSIPFDTTAARVEMTGSGPEVALTTMDDVLDGRPVDVVKIDVEGLEPAVLRGGRTALRDFHPALIVECLDPTAFDAVAAEVAVSGYDHCLHLGPVAPAATDRWIDHPAHANYLWTCGAPDLG